MFSASAPGKLIFSGEHAVVFGAMGLAMSIDRRTHVKIGILEEAVVRMEYETLGLSRVFQISDLKSLSETSDFPSPDKPGMASEELLTSIRALCGENGVQFVPAVFLLLAISNLESGLSIIATSDLPTGAGLGSSAAFCVSLTAALLLSAGRVSESLSDANRELINSWAYLGECLLHGNPSGIDNTTSTYGGAVGLQNRKAELLPKARRLNLLVTNTRVPRSTAHLVKGVRERRDRFPDVMDPIISSLGAISIKAISIIAPPGSSGDQGPLSEAEHAELEELVTISQPLLNSLGVGHPALDQVVALTAAHGMPSKLSGAGGGGCAFTLLPRALTEDRIVELKQKIGENFECFETEIGGEGVTVERN